jgi:hypothetical protein
MATATDLKVPHSRKSVLEFTLGLGITLKIDICERFGHVWNWHDVVPAKYDGSWNSLDGNVPFSAPFRAGFAWACEREGCDAWMKVSQMDSTRYVPISRQKVEKYGLYGKYQFDEDSPFRDFYRSKKSDTTLV